MSFWIIAGCVLIWPYIGRLVVKIIEEAGNKKLQREDAAAALDDPRTGRDAQWVLAYNQALRELNEGLDPDEERLKREIEPPKPQAIPRGPDLGSLLAAQQSMFNQQLLGQQQNAYLQQLGAQASNAQGLNDNVLSGLFSQQTNVGGRSVRGDDPASIIDKLLGGNKH